MISVAPLEPLVPGAMERAAREILGLQQGCQGPEKHVALSKSAAGRPISWDDEQIQVLEKDNEMSSEPTQS